MGLCWEPVIDSQGNVTGFKWTDKAPDPTNNIFELAVYVNDDATKYDFNYTSEHRSNMGAAQITFYGENEDDIFTVDGTAISPIALTCSPRL